MSRIKIKDLIPPPEELDNEKMKGIFGGLTIFQPVSTNISQLGVRTDVMGGYSVWNVLRDPSISIQTNTIK